MSDESDFQVDTSNDGSIGLNPDGELWFNACCDTGNGYLTEDEALKLRTTIDAFLTGKERLKRGAQ